MTDHPLTDKIIEEIAQFEPDLTDPLILNRIHDMQTAADWQLEQVFEWLYDNLYLVEEDGSIRYLDTINNYGEHVAIDRHQIIDDLEAAMRPQQ